MKIDKDISSEGEATLEIEVPVEETGGDFTQALNLFRREVNVPGFRPGRVPLDLVRRRWGREIMSEKADELARTYISKALKQAELEPGGQINVEMLEYGEDKPLRFKIIFPLAPDVKLIHYKGLNIVVNDVDITDTDIDNELEALRRKHALMRSIDDPATPEARLSVKVQEVDPSGLPLVGRPVEEKILELGTDMLGIGGDEQLLGIKAGEKRVIRVKRHAGELSQAPMHSAIITPGQVENDNPGVDEISLSVDVEKVEIPELPDLDDDFARTVGEKVDSLKTLREVIRFQIMTYVESTKRQMLESAITKRLIEDNPFRLSKGVVETTLGRVAERANISEGDREQFIEKHRRQAEADLRWVELRDEIAREENLTTTDEMVETELTAYAERIGEPIEKIRRKIETEEGIESFKMRIEDRNVMEFLITNADIEKRMMEFDEFIRVTGSQLDE